MTAEEIRDYCLAKKAVEEDFPFDETTLVFRVGAKIFLLLALDAQPLQFNIKSDPDVAMELREKYSAVLPGYHMSKKHWNTVICDGSIPKRLIFQWIDDSYAIVSKSLPKTLKNKLGL